MCWVSMRSHGRVDPSAKHLLLDEHGADAAAHATPSSLDQLDQRPAASGRDGQEGQHEQREVDGFHVADPRRRTPSRAGATRPGIRFRR